MRGKDSRISPFHGKSSGNPAIFVMSLTRSGNVFVRSVQAQRTLLVELTLKLAMFIANIRRTVNGTAFVHFIIRARVNYYAELFQGFLGQRGFFLDLMSLFD